MPLQGYMKLTDPGRISTIALDKVRRKKIQPTKFETETGTTTVYVRDCREHDTENYRGVVPVELFINKTGVGWVSIGIAKCCPLCWLILVPPEQAKLPKPLPLPVGNEVKSERRSANTAEKKKPVKRKARDTHLVQLKEFFKSDTEEFTTNQLMAEFEMPRATLNRILKKLVEEGIIFKAIRDIDGVRKATYSSIPE